MNRLNTVTSSRRGSGPTYAFPTWNGKRAKRSTAHGKQCGGQRYEKRQAVTRSSRGGLPRLVRALGERRAESLESRAEGGDARADAPPQRLAADRCESRPAEFCRDAKRLCTSLTCDVRQAKGVHDGSSRARAYPPRPT